MAVTSMVGPVFFFQAEDGIRDRNVTGVQTCALPISKIILSAFVLMAVLTQAARRAPAGYQDEDGFHLIRPRRPLARGRSPFRPRGAKKRLLGGWLFSDSRRPAKA